MVKKNRRKKKDGPLIPSGILPSYLATAFGEIYDDDGLAIFGLGLGLCLILLLY